MIKSLILKLCISILCGGFFYFGWMGTYLFVSDGASSIVKAILWLLAPIVTAAGFTFGILVYEQVILKNETRVFHVFPWPLIGCVIGAGVVYWFGPMLIVFGVFVAGTVSVVLRELYLALKN